MKLFGLSAFLARLEPLRSIAHGPRQARTFGLLGAAKPAVAAALTHNAGSQLFIVTAHPQGARDLVHELPIWTDQRVVEFPAIESLPYERVHIDRTVLAQRASVARDIVGGEQQIVVASIRALMQPIATFQPGSARASSVSVNQEIQLDRLLGLWNESGYTETALVDEPGTFARRGGVIDVFPAGLEYPVRIELFGKVVESLRTFDPGTQRSRSPIASVDIPPMVSLDQRTRMPALEKLKVVDITHMNAEAQTLWLNDLALLEAGSALDELILFGPYLMEGAGSLVELLHTDAIVVVDTAQETWASLDDLWQQALDVQGGLEDSGNLPANLKSALLTPDTVRAAVFARRSIEWIAGSAPESQGDDWSQLFTPAHLFAGRLRAFVQSMQGGAAERIVLATSQDERVRELLATEGISSRSLTEMVDDPAPGVSVVSATSAQGWALVDPNVLLLTDHEIFGKALTRPVPRRTRPAREAFFADFAPGDYVVHLEHGIGRFDSVTRMSIEGAEREYAVVQYAGTDRVYVPTDQLERLTRYVGTGDTAPSLSKLGGGEWQRARQRAKQAATDIARELIELYSRRRTRPAHAFSPDLPWQRELETSFPYPETPDQIRAIDDVKDDMEAPHPMDRLVCADVGYGKTEVAVRAAFKAVMDGKQVALLVPTTILAQQHFETFSERMGGFAVKVEVLSRFRSPAQQRDILRRVATGEVDILIGTHRLLQKDVSFKHLGLLIIDEEQRFGVRHKEQLKKMREAIDVLTLTATPIPRTLHSGLVGIREISVIETPPEGRLPIRTYLQPFDERLVREAVLRELDRDGQVYLVHNKVATIEAMAERLRRLTPEARIVVAHGQMDDALLEKVMLAFARREADVLVCSTIIENGLDIPNVNTIVVNNAHRLGLTQLYQLRGRVGRSANQAYAYLLYPLDVRLSRDAARRMEAVFEAQDLGAGFSIAMKDLEIRGTGNLLGAEQSGHATVIGFDLYTRMIGEAVESLRGAPIEEPASVSISLPLTTFLPAEYVGSEAERLTLYRRLAGVTSESEVEMLADEMKDRFGPTPAPVENLLTVVRLKLQAKAARVQSISMDREQVSLRAEAGALYDRVSLYRAYGTDARISNALLRIPRYRLGDAWLDALEHILSDMAAVRQSIKQPEAASV